MKTLKRAALVVLALGIAGLVWTREVRRGLRLYAEQHRGPTA